MRWSKARRLALEAFFINAGVARRSNHTNAGTKPALAYWQSVDWLVDESLARPVGIDGTHELTEEGWAAGAHLWNVPPATVARMRARAATA